MTCPPGWVFPVNSPTNCYSIKTHPETWKDAQGYCNDDGANLVTLRTAAEEAYVLGMYSNIYLKKQNKNKKQYIIIYIQSRVPTAQGKQGK